MYYYRIIQQFTTQGVPAGGLVDCDPPLQDDGSEIDPLVFTEGHVIPHLSTVTYPLTVEGPWVDFLFTLFDIPVISERLKEILKIYCDTQCQFISIRNIPGRYILNCTLSLPCFDYSSSQYVLWSADDGVPSKCGMIKAVTELRIDPDKVVGHDLFRVEGWEVALIVSERVRDLLVASQVSGIAFRNVA